MMKRKKLKKNLSASDEVWCELAMALGGTIGELQGRMSDDEFELWTLYRSKYGPMNPVRRYDQGFALIAMVLSNVNGNKAKQQDFMPYGKEKDEEVELSGDEFANLLMAGPAQKGR